MTKARLRTALWTVLAGLCGTAAMSADLVADAPHACDDCDGWNVARAPFHVFGNTWFVGTAGLGSMLITSPQGHILIDGGLPQSAPLIAAKYRDRRLSPEDIKLILNSHTHYDHAGGIAALVRATAAPMAASPASKRALERGGPMEDDPQFAFGPAHNNFAPVANVRAIADGETLKVGPLSVTAHFTPGHTPGGTTWSWRECEGERCLNLVYADSLNSVSAPGFRFSGDATHAGVARSFEGSIAVVEKLPCDILLAAHPALVDLDAKMARWKENPAVNPLIDAGACKAYAEGARQRLEKRVAEERASKSP